MARNLRKLRYPISRSFKMKDETFKQLLAVAAKKDIKYTTLIRKIVEQWLWGHMNGPGKKAPGKGKNERLL